MVQPNLNLQFKQTTENEPESVKDVVNESPISIENIKEPEDSKTVNENNEEHSIFVPYNRKNTTRR